MGAQGRSGAWQCWPWLALWPLVPGCELCPRACGEHSAQGLRPLAHPLRWRPGPLGLPTGLPYLSQLTNATSASFTCAKSGTHWGGYPLGELWAPSPCQGGGRFQGAPVPAPCPPWRVLPTPPHALMGGRVARRELNSARCAPPHALMGGGAAEWQRPLGTAGRLVVPLRPSELQACHPSRWSRACHSVACALRI